VIRLIFSVLLIFSFIRVDAYEADDSEVLAPAVAKAKVLYLSYSSVPKRVIKGQVFSVTIKTLSTVKNFIDITYRMSGYRGLKILNTKPFRKKNSRYYYDTFYFLVTSSRVTIPSFSATLQSSNGRFYRKSRLPSKVLDVVTLNPKDDFLNIIADSFEVTNYKTSSYDAEHNIVVFSAVATKSDISALKFKNVFKQGIESIKPSQGKSKITYYAVIDRRIEKFSFSYFNLKQNRFVQIDIPIIVVDDSVATQTDLKPKDQSHERLKMIIAGIIVLIIVGFVLWKKKYIYLVFALIPLIYIAFVAMPSKSVTIKEGSLIYLLPVKNGTIFERTKQKISLEKEGEVKGFTKVKLKNDKIGWVKNEDID
jgi:hypothetical protein